MNSSILTDFCLICFNYHCQEEALHQKITFLSIQTLLSQNALLSLHLQKTSISLSFANMISHRSGINLSPNHQQFSKFIPHKLFPPQISSCTSVVQEFFSHQKLNQESVLKSLQHLILAYLSPIELMASITVNSLLYHDIMQILKYITLIKFGNKETTIQEKYLPFTKNRIQRTVRQLKQNIFQKEKMLKNIKLSICFQNTYQSNILRDLTNQPLSQNIKFGQNRQQNIDYKNINKTDEFQILQQILEETKFSVKLRQMLEKIPNQQLFPKKSESLLQFCMDILSQIEQLQKSFIQKIQSKKYGKYERFDCSETFYIHQSDKKNTQTSRLSLNPEKSSYPMVSHSKQQPKTTLEEIPQYGQFAYIEGLPFPTNRRSIDFSLLKLTDELLLSYLPALQKLKDLQEICIRKNKLSIIGYRLIKNVFSNLRSIDLRQNVITSEIVQTILDFKHLNILYLSQCKIQPASLVKICLNLEGINILYCDRLNFDDCYILESADEKIQPQSCDLRGIFYIMCLNLKKLMYFSVKGCFSQEVTQYETVIKSGCDKNLKNLPEIQCRQINILLKINETLRKRHGILEF